jgi:hypothetical protein
MDIVIYDAKSDEFKERALALLPEKDVQKLFEYISAGKYQISAETIASFFQLYLNGSSCEEIHRLNKGFELPAIQWAMVKYDWPSQKEKFLIEIQEGIRLKVVKAQLEAASLLSDIITAANKRNSDKVKKYIQTGNESDLEDAIAVDSIAGLLKVVEGLQKITGQDKVKSQHTENININLGTKPTTGAAESALAPEDAAKVLEIYSNAKRQQSR